MAVDNFGNLGNLDDGDGSQADQGGARLPTEHPLDAVGRLLADVDSAQSAQEAFERDAEVSDRVSVIWGRVSIADRLAAVIGNRVNCEVRSGDPSMFVEGVLLDCGDQWAQVQTATHHCFVNLAALISVEGLSRDSFSPQQRSAVERSTGWTQILRRLGEARRRVQVITTDGGQRTGSIDRVGADHFDLTCEQGNCVLFAAISTVSIRN